MRSIVWDELGSILRLRVRSSSSAIPKKFGERNTYGSVHFSLQFQHVSHRDRHMTGAPGPNPRANPCGKPGPFCSGVSSVCPRAPASISRAGGRWMLISRRDPAGKPKLAANEEQPSLSWPWQRCGGHREQNTGGTPMLPSARRHASLLRPVGASYLFEMSKLQRQSGTLCLPLRVALPNVHISSRLPACVGAEFARRNRSMVSVRAW
jgi:hypothetical protein